MNDYIAGPAIWHSGTGATMDRSRDETDFLARIHTETAAVALGHAGLADLMPRGCILFTECTNFSTCEVAQVYQCSELNCKLPA